MTVGSQQPGSQGISLAGPRYPLECPLSVTQAALRNEHCWQVTFSADTGERYLYNHSGDEHTEGQPETPGVILRGLSQSLGCVLTSLGLHGPYFIFPAHEDHGEKSGGAQQIGWEMEANVISNSNVHATSRRVFHFQGVRLVHHRHARCLPGPQGFCCCWLYLSERETPAFHAISKGNREAVAGEPGTRCPALTSPAGQGNMGPWQ